jgi:c-di-GMP phosphodiesterase
MSNLYIIVLGHLFVLTGGNLMRQIRPALIKYSMLAFALLFISFIDNIYRNLFSNSYNPIISALLVVFALSLVIYIFHIFYLRPYKIMLSKINKCYKDMVNEVSAAEDNNSLSLLDRVNSLDELFNIYESAQKQHLDMVCQLKNTNKVLDQNNKFANAIVQITSEILRSGDIHSILQLILNKAIEIIPNAQKGSILLSNKDYLEYKAMYGYDMDALKDFKFSFNEIFQYHVQDIYEPMIITEIEKFNSNLNKDKFNVLKDTNSFDLKCSISCAISIDNQFYGTINIDNTENSNAFVEEHKPIIKYFAEQIGVALKNAQLIEKILYLSQYDSLTNICNRSYCEEQLNILHKECEKSNQNYSLVIADMNDLKLINDSYGHEAGDKLIVAFTDYISNLDQKPEIFARIGGDEFAFVYSNKSSLEVHELLQDIKSHFYTVPFNYNNKDLLNITFSSGICAYPDEAKDIPTLFRIADQRMYDDKRHSKA